MPVDLTPEAAPPGALSRRMPAWAWAAALGLGIGGAAYQLGGWPACAALAATAAAGGAVSALRRGRSEAVAPLADAAATSGQHGRLAEAIVPVWKRNIEAARSHSERSTESLLESFASVSGHLDQALASDADGPQLDFGSLDQLIERHQPELEVLLATHRRIAGVKDEVLAGLAAMGTQLATMTTLAKEVQTIGRATQLLALNASVEATRAERSSGGFAVVAQEVRDLAHQSREAGLQIGKQVEAMQQRADALARSGRRLDTDDDELALQTDAAARAVLGGLVGGMAEFSRSSRGLRDASRQVQSDLERIYMALQAQDRLSQMLGSVTEDMTRFESTTKGETPAIAPTEWLERLDAAYTMEEMRTSHHGTVAVERQAEVEFF